MNFLLNTYEYKENQKNLHYNIYQNLNICKKQFDINNNEYCKFFNQTNEFLQSLKNFLLIYTNEIINKGYSYFSPCNNNYFQINLSKKNCKEINLLFLNNGDKDWTIDKTFLKINEYSGLLFNDIKLSPLSIEDFENVNLKIPFINEIDEGIFNIIFDIYVYEQKYGKPIKFKINFFKDKNQEKINKFRRMFDIKETDFSDERILDLLKKNNFDFEKTFENLFE